MSDKLTLKLNGEAISISMDDNGRYCLNDVYKASGKSASKAPQKFLRSQHEVQAYKLWNEDDKRQIVSCENLDSYVIQVKVNRATKTFGSRKTVFKYAMFIDENFYEAVVEAFDNLATGNVQKAANIASEYTLTPEIVNKYEKRHKQLMQLLKETYPDNQHIYSNVNRLLCKVATAYTPKELTGGFNSAVDHIKQLGHMPAMNAYIAAVEIMLTLITAGVTDYHVIASALQVKTTKNGSILKVLN